MDKWTIYFGFSPLNLVFLNGYEKYITINDLAPNENYSTPRVNWQVLRSKAAVYNPDLLDDNFLCSSFLKRFGIPTYLPTYTTFDSFEYGTLISRTRLITHSSNIDPVYLEISVLFQISEDCFYLNR